MLALCLILAIRICLDYTKQMIKKTDTANHGISGEVRRAVVYARVSSGRSNRVSPERAVLRQHQGPTATWWDEVYYAALADEWRPANR